jgi:NIPSNAP
VGVNNDSRLIFSSKAMKSASVAAIALISFLAGTFFPRITHPQIVQADSDHVFELMVYHALPGKAQDLESVFQGLSKLQAKHGLKAIGYWLPDSKDPAWENTFVYLLDHPSREAAETNWNALHSDPAFPPYRKAAAPLIQQVDGEYKVDEVYMRPSIYSDMK